jgi:NADP-dependent 3-hydroxy acid dehydrogenase YdfG
MDYLKSRPVGTALSVVLPTAYIIRMLIARFRRRARAKLIASSSERVLVLGASSGVGRAIVKKYAARGAKVFAVARRAEQLASLARECGPGATVIYEVADFSDGTDMIRVRERLVNEWGGLDSIHIIAGVSALQPIMSLAGIDEGKSDRDANREGIQEAVDIANRAVQGNFTGPLVSAIALVRPFRHDP